MKPEQTLAWMQDGTKRLLADVAGLPDGALDAQTALRPAPALPAAPDLPAWL